MGSILALQTTGGTDVTMSSREIAELTGKEHRNVMADIRAMLEQLEIGPADFSARYLAGNNQEQPMFVLPKDLTYTLVSGYNVVMRKAIIVRWMELETRPAAVDPLASLPPEQRALVAVMIENAEIKRVQAEQGAAIARIEQRVEENAQAQLMLARPANAEATVHIRERINKLYGLPPRIIDTVLRQSLYAPKPAGMVKNTREEAKGASYAVYWTKDISALFARFVSECEMVTATQATHPLILGRFKLAATEAGNEK